MNTRLLFATSNPGKLREVRQVLEPLGFQIIGLDDLGKVFDEPVEDASTFEGNARIKARSYAAQSGTMCLAEDSGLEVDALNGAPGVHSARYAGTGNNRDQRDRHNNEKLLYELSRLPGVPRDARFVCAMCLCRVDGSIVDETRGTFEGVVTDAPRGENGFGYDPLLLIPDLGRTAAELSPDEKNERSHRGQAARALAERLKT